jgi:REP element-mobilizing transposase RayT
MAKGDPLPQRKSPRLRGYDYSQAGAYFVTICTHHRLPLFGEIHETTMNPTPLGSAAASAWLALPGYFPRIQLDAWVIMPNHMHGILAIGWDDPFDTPPDDPLFYRHTLGTILNNYKGSVTRTARQASNDPAMRVWQTRYHDHIIRRESELQTIREYIGANPARWSEDKFVI